MKPRRLGSSGLEVSPLGLGCWPIGGEMYLHGVSDSYGAIDDKESIRAIHGAIHEGVTFFDTADCYGAGHSEEILGRALQQSESDVVVATKGGFLFDSKTRNIFGEAQDGAYFRSACEASLRRLQRDTIDLYQVHLWQAPSETIDDIIGTLESLKTEGLIRAYGWSTDNLDVARRAVCPEGLSVLQHEYNAFNPADDMLAFCRERKLGSLVRSPLAMGLLSGKYGATSKLSKNEARGAGFDWVRYFKDGKPVPQFLEALDAIRDILRSDGRTVVQGAIAYIWGKSEISVPIPGFKSVAQAVENARAMRYGPLRPQEVAEIDQAVARLLKR